MQEILYSHLSHKFFICNYIYSSWEADLLTVTDAGFMKEFEIKLNKADYYNDFKNKPGKHYDLKRKRTKISQFWFVIHGFKLSLDKVPEYAGLMEGTKVIKKAPKLCNIPISIKDERYLFKAIHNRYWNLRFRNRKQAELF